MVFPDTGVTQPPSPTPTEPTATPSPTTGQPVTPSGDLQPVGLLPLVVTSGTNLEKSYLKVYIGGSIVWCSMDVTYLLIDTLFTSPMLQLLRHRVRERGLRVGGRYMIHRWAAPCCFLCCFLLG